MRMLLRLCLHLLFALFAVFQTSPNSLATQMEVVLTRSAHPADFSLATTTMTEELVSRSGGENGLNKECLGVAEAFLAQRIGIPRLNCGTFTEFVAANRVGYHATHADVVPLIQQNGFRAGTAPGRLGSGGTYVNSSPQGAIAEFAHHNPGVTPSVLKVQYNPGINASTTVAPRNYVDRLPFNNVDSISAPSVRLPGMTNTNVLNGSLRIIE